MRAPKFLVLLYLALSATALAQPTANDVFVRVVDTGPGLCCVVKMPGPHYMIYDAGYYMGDGEKACIDGIMDSVPGGDDWIQVVGEPIVVTGLNGICETTAVGDDVQIIDPGNGAPDHLCVGLGDNGFRDTNNVDVGDTLVADGIGTGPDGICNSVADDTNVLSTDFGTEALIRDYLNNVIYNQAVVWWDLVSKFDPVAANFDLDRNGFLDVAVCDTAEILALTDGVRAKVLAATGEDLNEFEFNVFLVDRPSESLLGTECAPWVFVFVGQHGTESVTKTIAHELGHAQGLVHPDDMGDPDVDNLMHSTSDGEKLRKGQWDDLHTGP